ncbi:hypothetical protein TFLX_04756 [Thermoflexales bacterium]|nr:hypothetical protein TFLX_04756 [Thermoflexales bacterium]
MKSHHQKMTANGIVVLIMLVGSLAGLLPGKVAATNLKNRLERDPRLPNAADFDQDSFADLVVGVEWEDAGSVADAGAVNILYGSSGGISATGDQFWNQDSLVAADGSEEYDYFGQVLAAGDFDGDGAADLAVGVPGEDIGTAVDGGAVHVLYGSNTSGLVATGNQLWHQGSSGVDGAVETDDRFGKALAVGDFDGDGYDDLAVGAPYEDIDTEGSAGAVNVLYGSANGLTATGNQLWYEGYNGLGGEPEANDWFGYALAAGDFDLDGHDDLAVGLPGENLGTGDVLNAGRVAVIYGTQNGLSAAGYQGFAQGVSGVLNSYEENDYFGDVLTTGDFDGDRYVDLAVGVPREDNNTLVDTGAVNVLYGSSGGLTAADNEIWFDGGIEEGDEFGRALAAGDFNGDGFDELAVGIPYEDLASLVNTGAVDILYGSSSGLDRRVSNDLWHQDRSGMEDGAEEGDLFGIALAAGDFDKDKYVDLAVGIRNEDVSTIVDTGAVHVLYGSSSGIAVTGNRFWHQDIPNVEGLAETNDHFGCALAAIPPERHKVYLPLIMR